MLKLLGDTIKHTYVWRRLNRTTLNHLGHHHTTAVLLMPNLNKYFKSSEEEKNKRGRKRRKNTVLVSSSEEEIIPSRKVKKKELDNSDVIVDYPSTQPKMKLFERISSVKPVQTTDPESFFGNVPVNTIDIPVEGRKSRKRTETTPDRHDTSLTEIEVKTPTKKVMKNLDKSSSDLDAKTTPKKLNFIKALNREPGRMLNQRPLPVGSKNCLENLTFVISGVMEYFDRDDIVSVIQRYSGRVTSAVSGRTNYLIVGREPGQTKSEKAQKLGTIILNELQFYDMIENSAKVSDFEPSQNPILPIKVSPKKSPKKTVTHVSIQTECENGLWVDKYKPTSINDIVGQHGPKSPANKLLFWLSQWKPLTNKNKKNFFSSKEDGTLFKAALLSGPPGVGKTTTAHLVSKQLGLDVVEMNASDSRSKKALDLLLSSSLDNFRITKGMERNKSILIMDEVDGMSGNEDRGGIQHLVSLIKNSSIPVICICNDRSHPKIRSLSQYCFDLRFVRPRAENIRNYVLQICRNEKINIESQAVDQIIQASRSDIRQILNNLQMWSSTKQNYTYDDIRRESTSAHKDFKENVFETARKVFSVSATHNMSITDRAELFFVDYSIMPLFVFENYLHVTTKHTGHELISDIADTIDNLSLGNICERTIRQTNNWSLLPVQALFSTVLPSFQMSGGISGMVQFPQWMGKNSTLNKNQRILTDISSHSQLRASINKRALNLDLIPYLSPFLYEPLLEDGIDAVNDVISHIINYDFTKDDYYNIIDLMQFSFNKFDPIPTRVKTTFTKLFNKIHRKLPYTVMDIAKKIKTNINEEVENNLSDIPSETEDETDEIISKSSTTTTNEKKATRRKPKQK